MDLGGELAGTSAGPASSRAWLIIALLLLVVAAMRIWSAMVKWLNSLAALAKRAWGRIPPRLSRIVGAGFLIVGVWVVLYGFRKLHPYGSFKNVIEDFYANVGTELISIAFTVLIIDYLNKLRQERQLKGQLIRDMGGAV